MKIKKRKILMIIGTLILLIMLISSNGIALEKVKEKYNSYITNPYGTTEEIPYNGHLRIYIVEPESRWEDYTGVPYHFGFIDYAFDNTISINYLETYEDTIFWSGDVTEDNVQVIAALFNSQPNLGFSNPPENKPFEAYGVDASATATPGNIGYNTVTEEFTHTVFIEEATVNWCPDCPAMAEVLHNIYKTDEYPFIYVALIGDMNPLAEPRYLEDYNLWGYPTGYFDGGQEVLVGGIFNEEPYRTKIEASGQRDVHEVNLSLSVDWTSEGELEIDISITNYEDINTPLYEIGEISGGLQKVSTTIDNIGAEEASDVDWEIIIRGGVLDLIDASTQGIFGTLLVGATESIETDSAIFGLGKIDIITLADDTAAVEKGFVIGPFVLIT
jgi:hypothetical protein